MIQMLDSDTKVSVLICVYNGMTYLATALDSVLKQTYSNTEVIVVDDTSTDGTRAYLEEVSATEPRLKLVFNTQNLGVAGSRNRALDEATGEYVAIMDADDIAHEDRFAEQVEFLQRRKDVVCVGTNHDLIDAKGRMITSLQLPESNEEIQKKILAGHGAICNPTAMIRRELLVNIGGYDTDIKSAEDLDVWLKLGERGKLWNIQKPLLKYRIHNNSESASHATRQRESALKACKNAWERRGIDGYFEASDAWRPGESSESRYLFNMKYAWWSYNSSSYGAARYFAWESIKAKPSGLKAWNLLAKSIIHSPQKSDLS